MRANDGLISPRSDFLFSCRKKAQVPTGTGAIDYWDVSPLVSNTQLDIHST
jgi:hypothetical protein